MLIMMKEYQVTLICSTGQYKPVSCLIQEEQEDNSLDLSKVTGSRKKLIDRGIKKICAKRYWSSADLKRYHYTKVKIRLYDKAQIEAENKERYDAIKEAKYASGEWKRPKNK